MLTIRTCASRRNRATKDQTSPFSIPPSTANDDAADREPARMSRNVGARTSRLADIRSGNHVRPGIVKNLATSLAMNISLCMYNDKAV